MPPTAHVDALATLYATAGGPNWHLGDYAVPWNVLDGEPCLEGWAGISCCPDDHPILSPNGDVCLRPPGGNGTTRAPFLPPRRASRQLGPGRQLPPSGAAHGDTWPLGCGSGRSNGIDDQARCVVVRIDLTGFGLNGALNESLSSLSFVRQARHPRPRPHPRPHPQPHLLSFVRQLLLRNNSQLSGVIPSVVRDWALQGSLTHLDLRETGFGYPPPVGLQQVCARTISTLDCSGLPPFTCSAFSEMAQVSSSNQNECTICTGVVVAAIATTIMIVGFFTMMGGYAYVTIKYPERTTQVVSTIGILISHLQTITIVSKLRLAWPPSTKSAFSVLVVNGMQLEAARPECIFTGDTSSEVWCTLTLTPTLTLTGDTSSEVWRTLAPGRAPALALALGLG